MPARMSPSMQTRKLPRRLICGLTLYFGALQVAYHGFHADRADTAAPSACRTRTCVRNGCRLLTRPAPPEERAPSLKGADDGCIACWYASNCRSDAPSLNVTDVSCALPERAVFVAVPEAARCGEWSPAIPRAPPAAI